MLLLFKIQEPFLQRLPLTCALEGFFLPVETLVFMYVNQLFPWFSHTLWQKVLSSLNEGRSLTRIISNDDSIFNFIYFIKMKDFIVKTTRSLWAEWIAKTLSIVNVNFLGRKHGSHGQIAKEHSKNYIQRNKRYHTNKGKKFPLNGDCFRKWIL